MWNTFVFVEEKTTSSLFPDYWERELYLELDLPGTVSSQTHIPFKNILLWMQQ
jgi:hypothetical protein